MTTTNGRKRKFQEEMKENQPKEIHVKIEEVNLVTRDKRYLE